METITITLVVIAILLFLSGLLLGLVFERKQVANLYNGNVLITSQVFQLVKACESANKTVESERIKAGLQYLSEGFSLSETITIIKRNETILSNM